MRITSDHSDLTISAKDRDLMCQVLLAGGPKGGEAAISTMMSDGLSLKGLYLDVLGPVARHLGTLWREDQATFLGVSTAAVRIEEILRKFQSTKPIIVRSKKQAIFASVPGEGHTIGVRMAADLQRTKGWDIHLVTNASFGDLLSEIENSPAEILGLSIGSRASMHGLYSIVKALRVSRPNMKILVSGSLISVDTSPIELLGVDAIAGSFEQAETMMDELLVSSDHVEIRTAG